MRKRSVMVLLSFIGFIFLMVYSIGNLSESQKKVDIAKFEYEQSKLEVKKAEKDLDQLVYKILEIGEKQNNPILTPYLEQLSTAHRELKETTNNWYKDPTYENYRKAMLKLEALRYEINKVYK